MILLLALLAADSLAQLRGGWAPSTGGRAPSNIPSDIGNQTVAIVAGEDNKPLKFSTRTELVMVPVVVTNKSDGKHVSGLEKQDFTILENGDPQTITTFEEVRASAVTAQKMATGPNEFTNVVQAGNSARQLVIVALDTVNTPFLDQSRAREELIRYLSETIQPGSLVTLLTINRNSITTIHDFTTDPNVLVAALRKVRSQFRVTDVGPSGEQLAEQAANPAPSSPSAGANLELETQRLLRFAEGNDAEYNRFQQRNAVGTTLESFMHIANAYAVLPGRKALIWATGGFPFNIDDSSAGLLGSSSPVQLYQRVTQALNSANIAVYPVDVRGLLTSGLPSAVLNTGGVGPQGGMAASAAQRSSIFTLETFATMTGGRAFYNRNDLAVSFKEASQDSSAYYLIGYYLDKKNTKPGWRKLGVKVNREHVRVRARSGFFATQATANPEAARNLDLAVALNSPLDYTALPMMVRLTGNEAKGDKKKINFDVLLPSKTATIDEADKNRFSIDVLGMASNGEGKSVQDFSQTLQGKLKPEQVAQIRDSGVTYSNSLELPKGNYTLRFVMRDNLNGRVGSVSLPLKVD